MVIEKNPNDYHYFIIDEEAANNVRNIFKKYLKGKSKINSRVFK